MAKKKTSTKSSKLKASLPSTIDRNTRALILYGPDHFRRSQCLSQLRAALEVVHGEVELIKLEGAAVSLSDLLDELRGFSLMSQHKIVVLDDAEELLGSSEEMRKPIERYLESPSEAATIVFRSDSFPWSRIVDRVAKIGAIVVCDSPTEAEAVQFCIERARQVHGRAIEPDAAASLVDQIGTSLTRLDSELGRLSLMAEGEKPIDIQLVREQVGLSREEAAWDIQRVILSGDAAAALAKVRDLIDVSRQPTLLINFALTDLARKLYGASKLLAQRTPEYTIKTTLKLWYGMDRMVIPIAGRLSDKALADLVRDCLNVDSRSKSGGGDERRLIELLVLRFVSAIGPVGR